MTTHPLTTATGPKTADGKRIASRNATTHGLFARDVVLPHLGEDPAGYRALLEELTSQIRPKNLLDQHYTEKIAAASWRLRRLHRWQAQLFEDPDLTEDEALSRLDRVLRHETALHRQIDTAVKMLGKEVPAMITGRLREEQLALAQVTERDCREDPEWDWVVANNTREQLQKLSPRPASLARDPARLDASGTPAVPTTGFCQNEPLPLAPEETVGATRRVALTVPATVPPICQNEPAPAAPPLPPAGEVASLSEPEGVLEREPEGDQICKNEPAPALVPAPPELGGGGRTPLLPAGEVAVGAWHAKPSREATPDRERIFPHPNPENCKNEPAVIPLLLTSHLLRDMV